MLTLEPAGPEAVMTVVWYAEQYFSADLPFVMASQCHEQDTKNRHETLRFQCCVWRMHLLPGVAEVGVIS